MTILAVGVVVLAAVAVVAVPRLSGGGKNAALASADGRTTQTASGQYSPRPAPATSAAAATKEAGQSTQSPPPGPATQPADSPETHAAPSVARTGVRATPPGQGNPNTGPSSQSPSHEPIVTPVVNATANGTTVAYTWSAQSDGLTETLQVCIAGACTSYTVPAAGGYSGSATRTYGNSETETITAHLTDTAGQSSGTATASATTAAALVTVTPPPPAAVTVTEGPHVTGSTASGGSCASSTNCVAFNVSASNFTANAVLNYTCSLNGSQWFSGDVIVGGTAKADASGAASFETRCIALPNGKSTVTIQVSDGTHAASSSVSI